MSTAFTNLIQWSWLLAALLLVQPLSAQETPEQEPAPAEAEQPADSPANAPDAEAEEPAEASADTPAANEEPAAENAPAEEPPTEEKPAAEPAADDKPADDKPAEDKPAEDKPAEDKPAEEKPADDDPQEEAPAAAEGGQAAKAFASKLDQWKALLKEMRALQEKYQQAEDSQLPALRQQWSEMVKQGRDMLPELRKLGMAAFRESPGTDRQLSRFLIKMAGDAMAADRWEIANEMANTLLEANLDDKSLLKVAGVSAFVLNDYEQADKYLNQAKEAGVLTQQWEGYLAELEDYKKYWATEQQLREAEAKADDLPRVEFNTTAGRIVLELFENQAPQTVGNFVSLVESGFYDGTLFHRVLPNFMAQGGDPEGTGAGDPGYKIYDEVDRDDTRMHFRGSLSMAKTAAPDSGGSQFFLTFVPTTHLNNKHTVFGRVIEGMDVLPEIQRNPGQAGTEPTKIESAKVLRKREHEYKPTKVE